ncbi:hypothetical protein, partial [Micromonospora sp. NPDC050695]|uniref:hypothetical protein n=1 Tax=Micromonospora sp. NPDC050695 TaxID=3154938 RepID=UPI003411133D
MDNPSAMTYTTMYGQSQLNQLKKLEAYILEHKAWPPGRGGGDGVLLLYKWLNSSCEKKGLVDYTGHVKPFLSKYKIHSIEKDGRIYFGPNIRREGDTGCGITVPSEGASEWSQPLAPAPTSRYQIASLDRESYKKALEGDALLRQFLDNNNHKLPSRYSKNASERDLGHFVSGSQDPRGSALRRQLFLKTLDDYGYSYDAPPGGRVIYSEKMDSATRPAASTGERTRRPARAAATASFTGTPHSSAASVP